MREKINKRLLEQFIEGTAHPEIKKELLQKDKNLTLE